MKKVLLVLSVIGLLMTGCLDYEQKVVLKANGSGTMQITFSLDQSMMELFASEMSEGDNAPFTKESVEKEMGDVKGVRVISAETNTKGGKYNMVINLAFDDINKLPKKWMFESMRFSYKSDKGKMKWSQKYLLNNDQANMDEESMDMVSSMMKGHYFTFIVELPSAVVSANQKGKINGNTVTWKIPLLKLIKKSSYNMTAITK